MITRRRWLSRRAETGLIVFCLFWSFLAYSQTILKIPLYLRHHEIRVEVANTPETITQGLMGRKYLGKNEGMLFVFDTEDYHGFWMKNTLIPLSIAFIDKEYRIIGMDEMKPRTLDTHAPPRPILYALEMNQGWFSSRGIQVGDTIRFSK